MDYLHAIEEWEMNKEEYRENTRNTVERLIRLDMCDRFIAFLHRM